MRKWSESQQAPTSPVPDSLIIQYINGSIIIDATIVAKYLPLSRGEDYLSFA